MTLVQSNLIRSMWALPWSVVLLGCVSVSPPRPGRVASRPNRAMAEVTQQADAEQHHSVVPEEGRVAQDLEALPIHPELTQNVLSNGLRVLALRRGRSDSKVLVWLVVGAGSQHESQSQRGSARVLQHMAFAGNEMLSKDRIRSWFETQGSRADPNLHGYTSYDKTVYQLQSPKNDGETLTNGLKILRQWATGISTSQRLINATIKSMGKVQPGQKHPAAEAAAVHNQALLRGTSHGQRGSLDNPGGLLREGAVRQYYERWYRPDNAALIIVGPIQPDQTIKWVQGIFANWANPSEALAQIKAPHPPKSAKIRVSRYANTSLQDNRISLMLSRPAEALTHRAAYAQTIRRRMSIRMLNLRLQALSSKHGLQASQLGVFHRRWLKTMQATVLSASGDAGHLPARVALLNRELERISRHGFTTQQVSDAKAWLLARIRSGARRSHTIAHRSVAHALVRHATRADAFMSLAQELKLCEEIVPHITAQELRDTVATWANRSDRLIALSCQTCGDELSDQTLTEASIWPQNRPLEPWIEGPPDAQLLWKLPAPGRIISRNHLAEANLFAWKLSNGAEVVLKRTPGSRAAIRFEAIAPGGWSLSARDKIASAKASASLANACGLGSWSADKLRNRLKRSDIALKFRLSHLDHGLVGHAPTKHIVTLLEAVQLHFGPLRNDPKAELTWRKAREAQIRRRGLRWRAHLYDQVRAILYRGHPKGRAPSVTELAEVDPTHASEFLRARFQKANGFRFIVVGDIEPQRLEPLLSTYIASIPSGEADSRRDDGLRLIARGKLSLSSSRIERATRIVYFSQPNIWTASKAHHLKELASALRTWLPTASHISPKDLKVSASFERWPRGQVKLAIEFQCAPAALETTTSSVFRALERVRQQGIDHRSKTAMRLSQSLRSPRISSHSKSFEALRWRRRLADAHLAKTPLSALGPSQLPTPSRAQLQQIATLALTPRSYLTVTLLPR